MEGKAIYSEPLLFPALPSIQLFVFSYSLPLLCVQVFVKALFDYDPKEDKAIPCKEAGLAFKKGSILQIMSQDDATWWQAKHEGGTNPRAGLIPSKQFQER